MQHDIQQLLSLLKKQMGPRGMSLAPPNLGIAKYNIESEVISI